ncbi:tyrosine recombinase XerC [Lederbergia wuyishanensis]|uniref:Tyrosine recombinase XerC n=1 Tax=Lederbergia wuyishanensis TaxID=1347903 RepID=A0ABU0CZP4_9BACI|nr:tyrosine recombinase XerC [Lederbergia wuyishanensis]MCJ8006254.1 tyrosine recombinase XerC [Lederbergia wuyishanensis]MDQ0341623.1 integrase/recombinase XerC [Lederbergia wuyishanensis]
MNKFSDESVYSFIEYLQIERNYSEYTIDFYKKDIEHFALFMNAQGLKSFSDVEYFDARLYVTELYNQKLARASASRKISCLRSFYKFLLREGLVKENPFSLIIQPKTGIKIPSFFYEEEMNLLFEACMESTSLNIRNLALLELLYATGIRVSECANIQLKNVDFDFSTILVKGKGRRERYVPFGSFANEALQNYIQNGVRKELLKGREDHQYLFVNSRGGPLTDRGIRHILKTVIESASLTGKIHPHMIRHSFATHLLNNGADMRTVQELLGHSHLSSTQVYTHVTKEHLRSTYLNHHPRA